MGDQLDQSIAVFKGDLAAARAAKGRDYIRDKPQGFLLDALDAGAISTCHDERAIAAARGLHEESPHGLDAGYCVNCDDHVGDVAFDPVEDGDTTITLECPRCERREVHPHRDEPEPTEPREVVVDRVTWAWAEAGQLRHGGGLGAPLGRHDRRGARVELTRILLAELRSDERARRGPR